MCTGSHRVAQVEPVRYSVATVFSITNPDTISQIFADHPAPTVVGVEEHPQYKGNVVFQPHHSIRQQFYQDNQDWLSRHLTLNDAFLLGPFIEYLEDNGHTLIFMPSCEKILADYARWTQPLDIAGFTCPGERGLFAYQTFGLRRALERATAPSAAERLFFVNWAAGGGKSLFACAGAQELVNRALVDIVLAVTTSPLKINLARFFETTTELNPFIVEGTPTKRAEKYAAIPSDGRSVLVLNYDRFRVDLAHLKQLTEGRHVLFICDEVQKILTDGNRTQARKAFNTVVDGCTPTIWPMSASVVRASPLRYRDIFGLDGSARDNPLGTRADFERRYVLSRNYLRVPTKYGGHFEVEKINWNNQALHEIRHRVSDRTHAIRKTDPAIREMFKGMVSQITPVQMSREDGRLYDMVLERAEKAKKNDEGGLAQYAQLLRHICNNPLALRRTEVEFGRVLCEQHPKLITAKNCAKIAMLADQLEATRDAGDKVVVFTEWVHTSLELIAAELHRRDISFVAHHGGMPRNIAQLAQDEFRKRDGITVFLSSDAGAYGLNLPEARSVISYEPTFSWDILMQRSERINRADSTLDGLTSYTMVTDDTIEQRIAQVCEERRQLAANTLGTDETINTEETSESTEWLIFG